MAGSKVENYYSSGYTSFTQGKFEGAATAIGGPFRAASAQESNTVITITTAPAYIRAESTDSGILIKQAGFGEKFKVLDKQGNWYKVILPDNRTGWIFESFVSIDHSQPQVNQSNEAGCCLGKGPAIPVIAEFGGSILGGAIIGTVTGIATAAIFYRAGMGPGGSGDEGLVRLFLFGAGAVIGYPIGCASGTYLGGKFFHQNGKFLGSLLGAGVGSLVSVLSIALAISLPEPPNGNLSDEILVPIALIAPPAGAVLGYNASRPKKNEQGFFNPHFSQPSLGFKTGRDQTGKTTAAIDFRLINIIF